MPRLENSSETTRVTSFAGNGTSWWLAGIVDGSGYVDISKDGHAYCTGLLKPTEAHSIHKLRAQFGAVAFLTDSPEKFVLWRVHSDREVRQLFAALSGKICTMERHGQFTSTAVRLGWPRFEEGRVSLQNAWLTGFMEAVGSFNVGSPSGSDPHRLSISLVHKEFRVLDSLARVWGFGTVYFDGSRQSWIFYVSYEKELFRLVDYFAEYPFISLTKRIELADFRKLLQLKEKSYHLYPRHHGYRRKLERSLDFFQRRKKI